MKNFSAANSFYSLVFGFTIGILFRSFFDFGLALILFLIFVAIVLIALSFLFSKEKKIIFAISIFLISAALGIYRFHLADSPPPEAFESRVGQKVLLSGQIVDEPDTRENNIKLTVLVSKDGQKTDLSARAGILLSADLAGGYKYGDEISFSGILKKPENFTTDQGKIFDYVNFLRKDGILYVMKNPEIISISEGNGNKFISILYLFKNSFLRNLSRDIKSPESALAGGILLGGRSTLGEELKNNFIKAGLIHIVALSGFNVTIVAQAITGFFAFFVKRIWSIYLGIGSIILFALMTGGGATIVRASIMAILAFISRLTNRTYDVSRALGLALLLMLIHNPWILVYDVSFQLSFIATVGIIYLTPRFEKYFKWAPSFLDLRNIFPTTLAAYLFVLPFILFKMGTFSIVAIPANFLVLPAIPASMLFSFLSGLFGFIGHLFAIPFAFISYALLHYSLLVVNFFANLPFASFDIYFFPPVLVVIVYVLILFWIYKTRKSKELA